MLSEGTDAAVAALKTVRAKVNDYYGHCRLAASDARATVALNRAESEYLAIAAKDMTITADEVVGFPLSRIEAGESLPLLVGVNLAWSGALANLYESVVVPVLGAAKISLTESEWLALNAKFSTYESWLGSKAGSTVEQLGLVRIKAILAGNARAELAVLVALDRKLEPEFKAISDVERLTRTTVTFAPCCRTSSTSQIFTPPTVTPPSRPAHFISIAAAPSYVSGSMVPTRWRQ